MMPLRVAACVSMALSCAPLQVSAKFITLQVPGAVDTEAKIITNRGEVIGYFCCNSAGNGFIRAPDGTLDLVRGVPTALRKDGTVAGSYSVGKHWVGYIRSPDGQYTDVVAPHGTRYTNLTSLSNGGWISGTGSRGSHDSQYFFGFLRDPEGHYTEFGHDLFIYGANSRNTTTGTLGKNGFVRTPDGTIEEIALSGSTSSYAFAINDAGTVVGYSLFASGTSTAFIRASDGTISTFGVPGDNVRYTVPTSINKSGAIAGYYENEDNSQHGFIRAPDGTITPIDVPSSTRTGINSINDKGEIAGVFNTGGGPMGFIWKP